MATKRASSRRSLSTDFRMLIGVVADLETTIGFLLAGVGETNGSQQLDKNFMIVTEETSPHDVEHFFTYLCGRRNIGVIFVASDVIKILTQVISRVTKTIPIILEIPTKNTIVQSLETKHQASKKQKLRDAN
ncbi:V-type proton ATPase subunit F-like isoform X1 [Zeugodacus cucurbitae]|uniref:V-type proton ATPase subunit F-like isoform X1 n=1 Tax=Zeugodacus cucurbitae TaxID=28588 RepID=UPI0005967EE9|nr:V-type proton ATPase subunit F-like isoform X1 [Zeugodacus cucurbitae]